MKHWDAKDMAINAAKIFLAVELVFAGLCLFFIINGSLVVLVVLVFQWASKVLGV